MIEAHGLVKRYGSTMAVNDLSFSIRPGMVTGFLGPNGAGKPNLGLRHFSYSWRGLRHGRTHAISLFVTDPLVTPG